MGVDNNDYEKEALKVELEYVKLLSTLLVAMFSAMGLMIAKGTFDDLQIFLLTILGISICTLVGFMFLKTEKIAKYLTRLKNK